jgi:hypothetical protein
MKWTERRNIEEILKDGARLDTALCRIAPDQIPAPTDGD